MASLGRATTVMAVGTLTSRILGFVKVIVLAYAIGQTASVSADAFAVGAILPNTLFVMLMGGMLNSVLVPQIVQATKSQDGGSAYINKLLTLVITAAAALTACTLLAAPLLVKLHALEWDEPQLQLATAFAYWCLPQLLFYGIYTVMGEVLNARSVFGPYTWAPVINNVIAIAGIMIFIMLYGADPNGERGVHDWNAVAIAVLGGSATLGIATQALILFYYWRKAGIHYRPDFKWRGVGLGAAARLSAWTLAMFFVLNIITFITGNVIAVDSGDSLSISAVNNGWLIMVLPHSVFVYSIATAYFTRFSEAIANSDQGSFARDFVASLKQSALILVFFAAAFFALAPQLSRIIQISADADRVQLFALLLQFYIFAMISHSLLFVVQRGFYAQNDTRTVFFLTLIQFFIVVPLSIATIVMPDGTRSFAVVLIQGLGTAVQLLLAVVVLQKRSGVLRGGSLLPSLLKFAVAGVITAAVGYFSTALLWQYNSELPLWLALLSAAVLGIVMLGLYAALLFALKTPEMQSVAALVRRRLGR